MHRLSKTPLSFASRKGDINIIKFVKNKFKSLFVSVRKHFRYWFPFSSFFVVVGIYHFNIIGPLVFRLKPQFLEYVQMLDNTIAVISFFYINLAKRSFSNSPSSSLR